MNTKTQFEEAPGTVSKILWHFTGGPTWNAKLKKQNSSLKPPQSAYDNLISILKLRNLKLGDYREVVKVKLPPRTRFDPVTEKNVTDKKLIVEIESSAICCLSDIPAPHLRYHSSRYGKFAIGFHRDSVIQSGFNPVFYTLQDTPVIRSIYEGFSAIRYADTSVVEEEVDKIEDESDDQTEPFDPWRIRYALGDIDGAVEDIKNSLQYFISFIKTFDVTEFGTIYCEREWRSIQPYQFKFNEIAMIVLPKIIAGTTYYKNFAEKIATSLNIPRSVPIVPWDDLIEH